jgi:hypothetical protein
MIEPVRTQLLFAPQKLLVDAWIESLTGELIETRMADHWWTDQDLKRRFKLAPIDRHWNWQDWPLERDGVILTSEKIGVLTGDGNVQGAMLISSEPVQTSASADDPALFIELLFTAPRNRRALRKDGRDFFVGVGKILLAWAAWFSREMGYEGRIRLDGSPEFIGWYENRGLQRLDEPPIVYEGVNYTPMSLPPNAARKLIANIASMSSERGA